MKYPNDKFVVDHSEEIKDGKILIKKLGPSKIDGWEIDVLAYEVQNTTLNGFAILPSKGGRVPYPGGLSSLSKKEKEWTIKNLFLYGIRDERQ